MSEDYCYILPTYNPSRSDQWADEIARTWQDYGKEKAQKRFDALAAEYKLLNYEAVMLMDKVCYRKQALSTG